MQHGIIGDNQLTQLPETQTDKNELLEEKRVARYTKTPEYQKQKEYWEERIKFYQTYLPDGRPVVTASTQERTDHWAVANLVIQEIQTLMSYYENIKQGVESGSENT